MSLSINHMVLGFDFSAHARAALRVALDLAGRTNGRLHVVTAAAGAVDDRVVESVAAAETPRLRADFLTRLEGYVRLELANTAQSALAVEYHIGMGPAAEMLLAVTREVRADLVVLGAVGNRTPAEGSLTGADVLRVVRGGQAPVLSVRAECAFPPRRLLCGVDFGPASTAALALAHELAGLAPGDVEAIHALVAVSGVDQDGFALPVAETILRARHRSAERRMAAALSPLHAGEKSRHGQVILATPAEVLLGHLLDGAFDLLVLGTIGSTRTGDHTLGETATRLLSRAPCTVLMVPPPPPPVTEKLRWEGAAKQSGAPVPTSFGVTQG